MDFAIIMIPRDLSKLVTLLSITEAPAPKHKPVLRHFDNERRLTILTIFV